MREALGAAKQSLRAVLDDANPDDEAFLNIVGSRPRASFGFTHEFEEILSRVTFENAGGSTALIDTIYDSLGQLRRGAHTRRGLLIIFDGMDNHSRHSSKELLSLALESDVRIYAVGVDGLPLSTKAMDLVESKQGLLSLEELASRTGRISFYVRGQAEIRHATATIGRALLNQYTIGYVPRIDRPAGKWHKISVRVAVSGARAYARTGYRVD